MPRGLRPRAFHLGTLRDHLRRGVPGPLGGGQSGGEFATLRDGWRTRCPAVSPCSPSACVACGGRVRHSHGRPQLAAPAPRPEFVPRAAARCSRRHSPKRCPRRRRSARNSSRIVGNTLRRLQATPAAGIASAPCVSSRPPGRAGGFPGRPRSRCGSCAAGRGRCSPGRDRPVGPISGGDAVERLLACRAS